MARDDCEQGTLGRGLAYLRLGSGPPLVVAAELTADQRPLHGSELRFELKQLRLLAGQRTVWWVNRRQGLDPNVSMADIAGDYADVLRTTFDRPIDEPDDLLATIQAEDRFDVTDRCGALRLPVLVIGGSRDQAYDSGQVFVRTADRIPGARLILYPGKGHLGTISGKQLPRDVLAFLAEEPLIGSLETQGDD